MVKELLYEKLRPQKIEQALLTKRLRETIGDGVLHQNMLFHGTAGLGKTTLAMIMANITAGNDDNILYVNASDESSVEVVRNKINNFCTSISIFGGKEVTKVVILDELDGASEQFFKALRANFEEFSRLNCRFVATCNFINKIPEHMESRFQFVNFNPVNRAEEEETYALYSDRIGKVFNKLGITIERDALKEFVDRNFPDLRKTFNKVQSFQLRGVTNITLDNIKDLNYSYIDVYKLLDKAPSPYDNYVEIISNYSNKTDEVLSALATDYIEYFKETRPKDLHKIAPIVISIVKYQEYRNKVIDPAVNLCACIFEIQKIIHG